MLDVKQPPEITGRVLIVDDDIVTRTIHRTALSTQFDVETASSGEQALQMCRERLPDLVLMDIVMPNMDGYETCCQLRKFTDIPVIFVTSSESIDEQLKTFDVGGDDIIIKPVVKEILLRKVSLAIQRKKLQCQQKNANDSISNLAINFISAMGEVSVLQKFMQASLTCNTFEDLGQQLVVVISDFGLESSILIRADNTSTILTSHGEASEIEKSILEQSSSMGRIFQFKQKLVVNYEHVSIIVNNLPEEDVESGRMRYNITLLAEMTDALCANVAIRQSARVMAEQLQVAMGTALFETNALKEIGRRLQVDTRLLLQEMVDTVEKTYSWLGTSREQESGISKTMYASVERILTMLEKTSAESNLNFTRIQSALQRGGDEHELELF